MFQRALHGRRVHSRCGDGGAAAVEFAIVVPVLLIILLALIDFGRLFFGQVSLAAASREGARAASVGRAEGDVDSIIQSSAPGVARVSSLGTTTALARQGGTCSGAVGDQTASVTVSVPFDWVTPVELLQFYDPDSTLGEITLSSESEMLCVG